MMKKERDGCVKFVVLELVIELISVEGQSICLKEKAASETYKYNSKVIIIICSAVRVTYWNFWWWCKGCDKESLRHEGI